LLEIEDVHIEDVNSDNFGVSRGEPAASGGARDTSPFCVSDVTRRSDKLAEAMIISAQSSVRGAHYSIMTSVAVAATPAEPTRRKFNEAKLEFWAITGDNGENSRTKVQTIVADSTAENTESIGTRRRIRKTGS
jgi:hypothetical protein